MMRRMIVCVCNRIREESVRQAARCGARTPRAAYAQLGCQAKCGRCLPFACDVIDDELNRLAQAPAADRAA